ncbi:MAG: hypothetical protein P8013_02600 [Candidatus Sulfobium sp.]|jgi:hypothetical protein
MAIKDYCDNMSTELNGWQAKVFEVARKFDNLSTGEKEKIVPEVFALHMIIEELNERLDGLSRACDLNWKPESEEEKHRILWPDYVNETARSISQSDIGG